MSCPTLSFTLFFFPFPEFSGADYLLRTTLAPVDKVLPFIFSLGVHFLFGCSADH